MKTYLSAYGYWLWQGYPHWTFLKHLTWCVRIVFCSFYDSDQSTTECKFRVHATCTCTSHFLNTGKWKCFLTICLYLKGQNQLYFVSSVYVSLVFISILAHLMQINIVIFIVFNQVSFPRSSLGFNCVSYFVVLSD